MRVGSGVAMVVAWNFHMLQVWQKEKERKKERKEEGKKERKPERRHEGRPGNAVILPFMENTKAIILGKNFLLKLKLSVGVPVVAPQLANEPH